MILFIPVFSQKVGNPIKVGEMASLLDTKASWSLTTTPVKLVTMFTGPHITDTSVAKEMKPLLCKINVYISSSSSSSSSCFINNWESYLLSSCINKWYSMN